MADGFASGLTAGANLGRGIREGIDRRALADQMLELRRQQAQRLEEHRAYARDLQERQFQVQQRQADLNVVGRLHQILSDNDLTPEMQAFLLDDLAGAFGVVSPKRSERFQSIKRIILKMPADQRQGLSSALIAATSAEGVKPGTISQMVDGMLKGRISPLDVFKQVKDFSSAQQRQQATFEGFGSQPQPQADDQSVQGALNAPIGAFGPTRERAALLNGLQSNQALQSNTPPSVATPQMSGQIGAIEDQLGAGDQFSDEDFQLPPLSSSGGISAPEFQPPSLEFGQPEQPAPEQAPSLQEFPRRAAPTAPQAQQQLDSSEATSGDLSPAEWRRRAVRFFQNGMMEEGNAALRMAGQQVNTIETIRRKIAAGKELTAGENRVYQDALSSDPLARFLSALGGEQPKAAPSKSAAPRSGSRSEATFRSEAEVEKAVRDGRVKIGDIVIVNGQRMRVTE